MLISGDKRQAQASLSQTDANLYSLFVERAQALVHPEGIVALLTPSGIAADKGAARFFSGLTSSGRLAALFDFENKGYFFPDVHDNFKFVALVFGGADRRFATAALAFYLHSLDELSDPERCLELGPDDFAVLNPNTRAAPVIRHRRDAALTLALYRRHPVLVRHGGLSASLGQLPDEAVWPVKYATVFHMTNDSSRFVTRTELEAQGWREGFPPPPIGPKRASSLATGFWMNQQSGNHPQNSAIFWKPGHHRCILVLVVCPTAIPRPP